MRPGAGDGGVQVAAGLADAGAGVGDPVQDVDGGAGRQRRGDDALAEGGARRGVRAARRDGPEPDLGGQGAVRAQDRVTGVVAADSGRGVRPALTRAGRRGGLVRSEAGEAGHDAASVPGRSATTLPAAPAAALAAGSAANRAWGPCRNAAAPPSPAGTSTGSCSVPAARMPLTVRYDGSPAAAALAQAASSRPGWCLPAGCSTPCAARSR